MSLQRAKELITELGQIVAEEGMKSPEYGDFFFEAVAGLIIAKKAITRIEKEDARKRYNRESEEIFQDNLARYNRGEFGTPLPSTYNPTDSGAVSSERGVAGCDTGQSYLSGATSPLNTQSPQ